LAAYLFALLWKYLKARRTLLFATGAISLSVCALIVILSVMSGFLHQLELIIQETTSHIEVRSWDLRPIPDYSSLLGRILEHPDVLAASPRLEGNGILLVRKGEDVYRKWCRFIGIVPEMEAEVSNFSKDLVRPIRLSEIEGKWLIGGSRILKVPPVGVGEKVSLIAFAGPGKFRRLNLTVVDSFHSGLYEFDNRLVFLGLPLASELLGAPGMVNIIAARIRDPYRADAVKEDLSLLLGPDYLVRTWRETQANLLRSIELERTVLFVILLVLLVLSAFLVSALLIMTVRQKSRDIGILRALGAGKAGIAWVYLLFGGAVGLEGSLAGTFLAFVIIRHIDGIQRALSNWLGFQVWNPQLYRFERIPAEFDTFTVSMVVVVAVLLSMAASFYPAMCAARMDPVEAIRYE